LSFEMKLWAPTEKATRAGIAYGGFYCGKFYSVLLTYKGGHRGNHVHPYPQHTILLSGRARYLIKKEGAVDTVQLGPGDRLDVDAEVPHLLIADEEILALEWWDGEFREEPHVVLDI